MAIFLSGCFSDAFMASLLDKYILISSQSPPNKMAYISSGEFWGMFIVVFKLVIFMYINDNFYIYFRVIISMRPTFCVYINLNGQNEKSQLLMERNLTACLVFLLKHHYK